MATELFRIDDGVRRAKSAEIVGNPTISAAIKRLGAVDELRDLPIDGLRSPKAEIVDDTRFRDNNLRKALRGSAPPPIEVRRISREIPGLMPIKAVRLVPITPTQQVP